ncbi:MerR family transcriptional regulator [Actinopolymorpha pittospori]|uniref:DNA-binding transcriptional MerR regulator n=1 Tax=Actinopolymorpha pittospori TaxID=648752 RepID=A0A927N017_9ACTN|nr:MerR family transcriptional regulator [Actinopolymorpha pittospori]MBE1607828.1 DNA-binding transcriptional MerR regulator [Actinopolymorpha pittospori]
MRITEAARVLGMSARMLRYRERLGLVPRGRTTSRWSGRLVEDPSGHRRYSEDDVATIAFATELEERYDVSPVALAFALRAFAEPAVGAAVRDLGERLGRLPSPAARASEIDKERALRWLGRSGVLPPPPRRRQSGT